MASSNTFRIPFRPLPSLFGGGTVGSSEYIRSGREGKKRRTDRDNWAEKKKIETIGLRKKDRDNWAEKKR